MMDSARPMRLTPLPRRYLTGWLLLGLLWLPLNLPAASLGHCHEMPVISAQVDEAHHTGLASVPTCGGEAQAKSCGLCASLLSTQPQTEPRASLTLRQPVNAQLFPLYLGRLERPPKPLAV